MNNYIFPVISMWQPWAQFVLYGWKNIETRTHQRFKNLGGRRILIHAAAKWDKNWIEFAGPYLTLSQINEVTFWEKLEPQILCSCDVKGYKRLYQFESKEALIWCNDHPPRYGIFLDNIKPNLLPILGIKGSQGIWYYDNFNKIKVRKPKYF